VFEEIGPIHMSKKYILIGSFVIAMCIFIAGYRTASYFAHVRELETAQALKPTAESVLIALKGQGFLITQTYLFNQSVTIDHASGSFFKDLFWNQIVSARAYVKISSGVDTSKLVNADVVEKKGSVLIALPQPARYSTEIIGSVDVQNKQGVLKKLLDSDDGYNQALVALKTEAEKQSSSPELLLELQHQTEAEIKRFIQILRSSTTVEVVFR
jgi:hypothetical protein